MKLRKWFGLAVHRQNLLLAQTQMQPGDYVVYRDGHGQPARSGVVYVRLIDTSEWIIIEHEDRAILWSQVFEWIPSGHTAECTPQNCDIGGTAWRNRQDHTAPELAKTAIQPTAVEKYLRSIREDRPHIVDLTGHDSVLRAFVNYVSDQLGRGEVVMVYERGSYSPCPDPNKIWPRFESEAFRTMVMTVFPDGHFYPPDDLDDGWVFVHYPASALHHSPKD